MPVRVRVGASRHAGPQSPLGRGGMGKEEIAELEKVGAISPRTLGKLYRDNLLRELSELPTGWDAALSGRASQKSTCKSPDLPLDGLAISPLQPYLTFTCWPCISSQPLLSNMPFHDLLTTHISSGRVSQTALRRVAGNKREGARVESAAEGEARSSIDHAAATPKKRTTIAGARWKVAGDLAHHLQ